MMPCYRHKLRHRPCPMYRECEPWNEWHTGRALLRVCADICHDSYGSGIGYRDIGDLRYGIIRDGIRTILVFRGTANIMNIIRDVRFLPTRSMRGYLVHRGFHSAVDQVYQSVCHKIPTSARQDLIITGHSLGGAMALIMAESFDCRAVTFGCPRVYWRWGNTPMGVQHHRVVCDDDPVPLVPHVLYRHLCMPTGVLHDADGSWIDASDHGIEVYCKRLRGPICTVG